MARRKNTKRIDPRYFMDEKTDVIKEELTDYQREQGYDPEEKTFRTGGWGHSEDPTTPSPYDHLLD